MIKRVFWMSAGIAIGVIAVRRVSALREAAGPQGLNRMVGSMTDSVGGFTRTFRTSMNERETELRAALGLDDH